MKLLVALTIALFGMATSAVAQLSTEEIAIVQNLFGAEKRQLITAVLTMSPSDSVGFWPLYEKYEADRKELGKERITLIQTYVSKYPAISNEELNDMMEAALDLEEDQHDLIASYYSKIKKASSVSLAAQWLQIESYISAAVRLAIQEKLPFVGDIKKKK
jgi:hypothetical protein